MVLNANTSNGNGVAQMRGKSTAAVPPVAPGVTVQDPMTGEFTRLPDIDVILRLSCLCPECSY
jgi:hypothetical protein